PTVPLASPPPVPVLADLSGAAYQPATPGKIDGFVQDMNPAFAIPHNSGGLGVKVFTQGDQVVVAVRGTVAQMTLQGIKDFVADGSFLNGDPTPQLSEQVKAAADVLAAVNAKYGADHSITLTGDSLGGAIAQLLG